MHEIDEVDRRILRVMQADGTLSVTEIADRVGLSQSPCSRRVSGTHQVDVSRSHVL